MSLRRGIPAIVCSLLCLAGGASRVDAQLLWTVGLGDNGWPAGTAGGPEASFVQENGAVNPLPGSQFSTSTAQGADNDYYFAGEYTKVIPGNGDYEPVGVVDVDEEAAERAFAGNDLELRYHFNLPNTLKPTNLLSVTFDVFNLDTSGSDPRFGVEVYVNNVLVQLQIVVLGPQIDIDYTTPQFTLASVNAEIGPGADNIVALRGTSYNSDGGGNWMGLDYVQLNQETTRIPAPQLPWSVGKNDDAWPASAGGGTNTSFVQGNGTVNSLPGSPTAVDNDYYFAGVYTNVPAANGSYEPVGIVAADEESAERGFSGNENELRYHFNLPNTLVGTDLLAVTFDTLNLDTTGTAPAYGVEVYVNGVRVQPEVVIQSAQVGKPVTTAQFSLASVNAGVGPGFDNIVTLKGISHSAQGGGNSLGIDFVSLIPVAKPIPAPVLPWAVGLNDDANAVGNGGGANTTFVQENGTINPLPGDPNSPEIDQKADNDYYFAGVYSTVIPSNGTYQPVGEVHANEEAAERAFAGNDNELRYHFNLPTTLQTNDLLSVAFEPLSLDDSAADARYGVEVYFNNILVQTQMVIRPAQLHQTISTEPFSLAKVNAQVGPGFDNIVTLKGYNYSTEGGGGWMGFDYIQLNPVLPAPFPWAVGKDDNGSPLGNGGGPNTSFVQENGAINPLPGIATSPEKDQQSDNDYYFAGTYTNVLASVVAEYGDYTPIGTVLVNEESAERAFAGSDNDLRYHFNLPSTLKPTDQLMVTFDSNSLDTSGTDPHYGIEIYFNGVLVQPEIDIFPADIDKDFTTQPFTLASVNAQVGSGYDNIVSLKGKNFSADGGGSWMGIDYVQLNPIPQPVFPWAVGTNDNGWPIGDGGGVNATFVQENGTINDLPGSPGSPEINQQADNDYYFAGVYTNVIAGNGDYTPVGIVPRNEEAAERAFAGADSDLRYHFNLPSTLKPTNQVSITFDAFNLDTSGEDPRYGIEVYFNGVKVQDQLIIRTNQLDTAITTPAFTLGSVNAQFGLGADNIVSLRGVNFGSEGGGNWMGIDYVQLNSAGAANGDKPAFVSSSVANGKITFAWTGNGTIESAPSLSGPWTPVTGTSTSPYTQDIVLSERSRFYRIRNP